MLAIDPGTVESGYVWLEPSADRLHRVLGKGKVSHHDLLRDLATPDLVVIEMVSCYGLRVGRDIFETCTWIGRYCEVFRERAKVRRLYRRQIKNHLCPGVDKANDASIRAVLIDRYGPGRKAAMGRKADPGPLYGVTKDAMQALAVGVTAIEQPDLLEEFPA
ncbi:MAG: hypothetical protein AAFY88_08885 [Acidobacteriota bacterium]